MPCQIEWLWEAVLESRVGHRAYLGQHSGAFLRDSSAVQQPSDKAAEQEQLERGTDGGRQHAMIHTTIPYLPWRHAMMSRVLCMQASQDVHQKSAVFQVLPDAERSPCSQCTQAPSPSALNHQARTEGAFLVALHASPMARRLGRAGSVSKGILERPAAIILDVQILQELPIRGAQQWYGG